MRSSTCLTLLICLNLLLVSAIVIAGTSPQAAYAQSTGLADNYVVVSGKVRENLDALYLLDLKQRLLHTFYFRMGTRELEYGGFRNLEQDFRNNAPQ
jgi:hypothetical protein